MAAYTATFSDGSTKSIANSKRAYSAAWRIVVEYAEPSERRPAGHRAYMGFSRDQTTARKAARSEVARIVNKSRENPGGGRIISEEVISVAPV